MWTTISAERSSAGEGDAEQINPTGKVKFQDQLLIKTALIRAPREFRGPLKSAKTRNYAPKEKSSASEGAWSRRTLPIGARLKKFLRDESQNPKAQGK